MKIVRLSSVLLALLASPAAPGAEQGSAGEVVLLRGTATVTQDGRTLKLYRGASVLVGDQLRTGNNARLKLRMIDGTDIALGENSEFIVHAYELDTDAGIGKATLELTRGFFRAITGKITKLREKSFQVKTPLAVIGVRGTDFWGEQSASRFRVAMLSGTAIVVSNDYGSVEITEAGLGTEVTAPGQAPRAPFRWTPEQIKQAAGTVD